MNKWLEFFRAKIRDEQMGLKEIYVAVEGAFHIRWFWLVGRFDQVVIFKYSWFATWVFTRSQQQENQNLANDGWSAMSQEKK